MKSGDRYFMATVDLISAKERLLRILENVEQNRLSPSIELMSACISDITSAMIKTAREQLSDPSFNMPKACQLCEIFLCEFCRVQ